MIVSDILRVTDENTLICIHVRMFDSEFTTTHYKNYFLELEDKTLLGKEIKRIYAADDELHLVIK